MHVPVMVRQVVDLLAPREEGLWVDATVGDGGHAESLLEATAPHGALLGLDWDPLAIARAGERLRSYGDRVTLVRSSYACLPEQLPPAPRLRGVLLDAGVSSSQLDDTQRGFSFQREGPLDMRMSPSIGPPASTLLNTLPERELARIIWRYGEERLARRIARHIVRARSRGALRTVTDLARLIEAAAPRWAVKTKARVFQALRIAVNDELENLRRFLTHMPSLLPKHSRLVVISYHSLEDRLVKQAFRGWAAPCTCPPHAPQCTCEGRPRARLLTKRVMRPDAAEQAANPRSRSAKLRAVEWLAGPE